MVLSGPRGAGCRLWLWVAWEITGAGASSTAPQRRQEGREGSRLKARGRVASSPPGCPPETGPQSVHGGPWENRGAAPHPLRAERVSDAERPVRRAAARAVGKTLCPMPTGRGVGGVDDLFPLGHDCVPSDPAVEELPSWRRRLLGGHVTGHSGNFLREPRGAPPQRPGAPSLMRERAEDGETHL